MLSGSGESTHVVIKSETHEYVYSIDRNESIYVPGPLGQTKIVILDGTARISDSPCPGKICVHSGRIRYNGEWIACLPNKVLVVIDGGKLYEIDATSR